MGDLPVHCSKEEILGVWRVKATEPVETYEEALCGHHLPDHFRALLKAGDSFEAPAFEKNKKFKTFEYDIHILSEQYNVATICLLGDEKKCVNGTWEIVYDEGLVVKSPGLSPGGHACSDPAQCTAGFDILLFFKYEVKPEIAKKKLISSMENLDNFNSICSATMSGWWSTGEGFIKGKGCAIGKNIQPVEKAKIHSSEMRNEKQKTDLMVSPNSLMQMQSSSKVINRFASRSLERTDSEERLEELLDDLWKVDQDLVDYINSNDLGWTAHADSARVFAGMSNRQVNKMAGRHRYHFSTKSYGGNVEKAESETSLSLQQLSDTKLKTEEINRRQCIESKMPDSFSWVDAKDYGFDNVMTPVKNQGSCGSCYAVSMTDAASVRYRIANYNQAEAKEMIFDYQDITNCSPQNQGCDGGYPMLVGYYGKHYGFVSESCNLDYDAEDKIKLCKNSKCKRYKAEDYGYINGNAFEVSVADMMKDIIEHGPIAVAIDAPQELFVYQKGIIDAKLPKDDLIISPDKRSFWEKTTHAVVVVGWGRIGDARFWIVKNSWGPEWGENGYFRVPLGSDRIAIEALPSAVYFRDPKSPANQKAPDTSGC